MTKYKRIVFALLLAVLSFGVAMLISSEVKERRRELALNDLKTGYVTPTGIPVYAESLDTGSEIVAETEKEINAENHTDTEGAEDILILEKNEDTEKNDEPDILVVEDDPDAWYHYIDVDVSGLRSQNPDIVGWIYFENEDISYPLLYSGDDYYLRRDHTGADSVAGSIYIEGHNKPDLSDVHTLIYGHNMRNLSMFGKLKYYKDEDGYYDNHRYFQIIMEGVIYRYEIFAYKDVDRITGGIYTVFCEADEDFKDFVDTEICKGSYIPADMDVNEDTHILTLSTCSPGSAERFTVSALRIDEHTRK